MQTPLVSVIIPVYNSGASAEKTLASIKVSDYKNYEVIFVDDGSTDDSLSRLRAYAGKKIKVISKVNGGVSSARNLGIKSAKGNYIVFVDSDDLVSPTYLSRLVELAEKKNSDLVSCGIIYNNLGTGEKKDLYLTPFPKKPSESKKAYVLRSLLSDGRLYVVYNKIFRTDLIWEYNLAFAEDMDYAEDTKFVLDYLSVVPGGISFITEPLYVYNYGTSPSSLAKRSEADWEKWQKSLRNLRLWLGPNPTLKERSLYHLVALRWRIACLRAKRRNP